MKQMVLAVDEISINSENITEQIEHICSQGEKSKETRLTMEDYTRQLSSQTDSLGELTSRFKLSTLLRVDNE